MQTVEDEVKQYPIFERKRSAKAMGAGTWARMSWEERLKELERGVEADRHVELSNVWDQVRDVAVSELQRVGRGGAARCCVAGFTIDPPSPRRFDTFLLQREAPSAPLGLALDHSMVITRVDPHTPAHLSGLTPKMKLLAIDGHRATPTTTPTLLERKTIVVFTVRAPTACTPCPWCGSTPSLPPLPAPPPSNPCCPIS